MLRPFHLEPEEPEPDPIWKVWLPETPWRPPLPHVPELQIWQCRICGARGCPVPGYPGMDGGTRHVMDEHADVVAAMVEAAESLSTENEPEPEPEEKPMDQPVPENPDLIAQAEALNAAVRQLSDLLLGACATLEAEGWTPEQARSLVLKTYLGVMPS
jgi:hypothetical protein